MLRGDLVTGTVSKRIETHGWMTRLVFLTAWWVGRGGVIVGSREGILVVWVRRRIDRCSARTDPR